MRQTSVVLLVICVTTDPLLLLDAVHSECRDHREKIRAVRAAEGQKGEAHLPRTDSQESLHDHESRPAPVNV